MTSSNIWRVIGNLFIGAFWLWVFSALGWITFKTDWPLWQTLALTALVCWLVQIVFDVVYYLFVVGSCFIGCFTIPIKMFLSGGIILWGTSILTHWFTVDWTSTLAVLVMTVAFGILRIPTVSVTVTARSSAGSSMSDD